MTIDPSLHLPLAVFALAHLLFATVVFCYVAEQAGKPMWGLLWRSLPYWLLAAGLLMLPCGYSFVLAALALIAAPFTPSSAGRAQSDRPGPGQALTGSPPGESGGKQLSTQTMP
jgi:hypothetical protein